MIREFEIYYENNHIFALDKTRKPTDDDYVKFVNGGVGYHRDNRNNDNLIVAASTFGMHFIHYVKLPNVYLNEYLKHNYKFIHLETYDFDYEYYVKCCHMYDMEVKPNNNSEVINYVKDGDIIKAKTMFSHDGINIVSKRILSNKKIYSEIDMIDLIKYVKENSSCDTELVYEDWLKYKSK